MRRAPLALLAALAGCAPPASAPAPPSPPAETQADGPWRHDASGMVFPAQVAGFNRTRIAHFKPDASDAAVAYDLVTPRGGVAATVYLHKAPEPLTLGAAPDRVAADAAQSCRAELQRRTAEMLRSHLQPSPARVRDIAVIADGVTRSGLLAVSSYPADLAGAARVTTALALFCQAGPGWTLEFRYTFPDTLAAEDRAAAFMGGFDWSPLG